LSIGLLSGSSIRTAFRISNCQVLPGPYIYLSTNIGYVNFIYVLTLCTSTYWYHFKHIHIKLRAMCSIKLQLKIQQQQYTQYKLTVYLLTALLKILYLFIRLLAFSMVQMAMSTPLKPPGITWLPISPSTRTPLLDSKSCKKIHITTLLDVHFEVVMVVQHKTWCFCDVMPHHLVIGPHHFTGTMFLSNVRNHLLRDLVSYPRILEYSYVLLLSTTNEQIQSFPSCPFQICCPSDISSFKCQ
jgi:hypothetical protein